MSFDFDHAPDRRGTNSAKWTFYPADVLPLWVADMDFPAPRPIVDALHTAVEHGVFGYELAGKRLSESAAARMQKLYGWQVDPESVVATPGLVSAFYAAAGALTRPGDGYLIQPPVYMPFNDIQKHWGAVRQEAGLAQVVDGRRLHYEIDWDVFQQAFNSGGSRTRMFLLCNPHNPSGQVYTREELARMAELCLKNDTVIVSDEIHSELLLDGHRHTPVASLSPEIAARSITLIAPSKTFNIAGLFCGFAIIPDPGLRAQFKQQVERMTLHVNSLGQVASLAAFSGECDEWLAELLAYLNANRDFAAQYIEQEIPLLRTSVPQATYLLWLDAAEAIEAGRIDGSPFDFFLKQAKVALNAGLPFGTGGASFVRLNFGCPRSTLEQALERIRLALG